MFVTGADDRREVDLVHPRRMTALVVAGTIVAGSGAWALARVVEVTSSPPTARAAPIRAVEVVESPSEAPSTTTSTTAAPVVHPTVHVWHPAPPRVTVAPPPPPVPVAPPPVVVAPVVVTPVVPSCGDDHLAVGGTCVARSDDGTSRQRSGSGAGSASGTQPTSGGGTGSGTHQDN